MVMAEELGGINCGGVGMGIGVHTDMATPALNRFGSDHLKKNFLAPAIAGDVVVCLGVSEPGGGSDVAAVKTTARRDGDDLVINGTKMWITNGMKGGLVLPARQHVGRPGAQEQVADLRADGFEGHYQGKKSTRSAWIRRIRRSCFSTMCACRQKTSSARKAWASPCRCCSSRKSGFMR
jgi:alkylation response protein AidB-like acyl-CoA dehydrogenase